MECPEGCISTIQCDQESRSVVTGATALVLIISIIQFFCLLKFFPKEEQETNEVPPPYSEEI